MDIPWQQVAGICFIGSGIYWIVKRDVPVGIEGRPPSGNARGKWAVILGVAAIALGVLTALEILRFSGK